MENVKKFTMSIIDKVRVQAPAPADAFGEDSRGDVAKAREQNPQNQERKQQREQQHQLLNQHGSLQDQSPNRVTQQCQ